MNYKTIINTPELITRDTLFIKYLDSEIQNVKNQYDYHNNQCNQGKTEEHNTNKHVYYNMLLELKMVKAKFFIITDNPNQETNQ